MLLFYGVLYRKILTFKNPLLAIFKDVTRESLFYVT